MFWAVLMGLIYCMTSVIGGVLHETWSLPYEDCGSKFDIVHLKITSCTKIPCRMIRGSTPFVQTVFNDFGSDTQFLKHSVNWIFNAIKTSATISPDPCDGEDECLSSESGKKSYWAKVFVNETLPSVRGTMLWEAGNNNDKNLICFKIPVSIVMEN